MPPIYDIILSALPAGMNSLSVDEDATAWHAVLFCSQWHGLLTSWGCVLWIITFLWMFLQLDSLYVYGLVVMFWPGDLAPWSEVVEPGFTAWEAHSMVSDTKHKCQPCASSLNTIIDIWLSCKVLQMDMCYIGNTWTQMYMGQLCRKSWHRCTFQCHSDCQSWTTWWCCSISFATCCHLSHLFLRLYGNPWWMLPSWENRVGIYTFLSSLVPSILHCRPIS